MSNIINYEEILSSNLSYEEKIKILEDYKKSLGENNSINWYINKFENGDYLDNMIVKQMNLLFLLHKELNISVYSIISGICGYFCYLISHKQSMLYIPILAGGICLIDLLVSINTYSNFNKYEREINNYQMILERREK